MTGIGKSLPHIRSLLFVPGNRPEWIEKAQTSEADAIVVDLEDAVPINEKYQARNEIRRILNSADRLPVPTFVRVNSTDSSDFLDDVRSLAPLNISGIMVPKVTSITDILVAERTLSWFEEPSHAPLAIIPVLETAWAIRHAYDVAQASKRVAYMGGISSKGGDVERAIGYRWSTGGAETHPMRSQVLLDARAADVHNPLSGLWSDVQDLGGLENFALASRNMGYEGLTIIHPSHAAIVNEVFTPTQEELASDRALVETMEKAQKQGRGAVQFRGHMVDEAMAATSRLRLERYNTRL